MGTQNPRDCLGCFPSVVTLPSKCILQVKKSTSLTQLTATCPLCRVPLKGEGNSNSLTMTLEEASAILRDTRDAVFQSAAYAQMRQTAGRGLDMVNCLTDGFIAGVANTALNTQLEGGQAQAQQRGQEQERHGQQAQAQQPGTLYLTGEAFGTLLTAAALMVSCS
jgi:hypothetical protein